MPARTLAAVAPDVPMYGLVSYFGPEWCEERVMAAGVGRSERQTWVMDSGASHHCTADRSHFHSLWPLERRMAVANGQHLPVLGVGNVWMRVPSSKQQHRSEAPLIELTEVLWVPELTLNLISISRAMAAGNRMYADPHSELLRNREPPLGQAWSKMVIEVGRGRDKVMLEGWSRGPHMLYVLEPEVVSERQAHGSGPERDLSDSEHEHNCISCPAKVQRPHVDLLHRRMGHLGYHNLRKLVSMSGGLDVSQRELDAACRGDLGVCEECRESNMTRPPFSSSSTHHTTAPLELLHSDVCGPIKVEGRNRELYFLTLVDDWSGASMVSPLRSREEVPSRLKSMMRNMQTVASWYTDGLVRIKGLRSDRGREFLTGTFRQWLEQQHITHQLSCPYTPEQNGTAERLNRTLCERARAMLREAALPGGRVWWPDAVLTASYLRNRSPADGKDATPWELLTGGGPPQLGHIRVWGCQCWVLMPRGQREDKFCPRGESGRLVGFADSSTGEMSKGYKVWLAQRDEVVVSRSVAFDENVYWVEPTEGDDLEEVRAPPPHTPSSTQQQPPPAPQQAPTAAQEAGGEAPEGEQAQPGGGSEAQVQSGPRRSSRLAAQSRMVIGRALVTHVPEPEPASYAEAMSSSEAPQWRAAMEKEVQSLRSNGVYTLKHAPAGQRVLPGKWVFKRKVQADSGEVVYKARFVAKGFAQREGLDYTDVFAPVSTHTTLRTVLSMVAQHDMELHQLDIATAFLNGDLGEQVWVQQPAGFEEGDGEQCWHLHKALYGLKQAPRAWYQKLRSALEELGFTAAGADSALFSRVSGGCPVFLVVYVDDILVAAQHIEAVKQAKHDVLQRFKGRDMGEASVYLGVEIKRDRAAHTLTISQAGYAAQLLQKHGMEAAKGRSTPLDAGCKLSSGDGAVLGERESRQYAELVGSLLYLSNCTRPDLAFATGALARFMSAPTGQHAQAAKQVLRYLVDTHSQGITYSQQSGGGSGLVGYGDADYGGCVDTRRSTTGFVFVRSGGAVAWCSKRQGVVALSTAEAEYVAAAAVVREAMWLRQLEWDLKRGEEAAAQVQLFTDNQAALALLHGAMGSRRVKHIDIVYHFSREHVESGEVCFSFCPTGEMAADCLTKALGPTAFRKCKEKMGMGD